MHINKPFSLFHITVLLSFIVWNSCASDKKRNTDNAQYSSAPKKIRVIHTTDIGMDSQDDQNTLVRTLLFSNDQNIIGLIPSGGPWQKEYLSKEYERILAKIDLYAKVYDNLKLHDPDYPTPDYLRSVTARGNVIYDDYSIDTDGSLLIAKVLLDESDDSPVWVTCWGGPVTVTAALRYINDNYPEKKAYVAKKLRIYFIAAKYQDRQPDRVNLSYIIDHYDPAPLMLDAENYEYTNGWGKVKYWCDNVAYSTEEWTNENLIHNHGPLTGSLYWRHSWNDDVDGDAPSVLHILGSQFGLRSTEDPSYGGWGSRFNSDVDSFKCHVNNVIDEWNGPNKLPANDPDAEKQAYCYSGARWADDFQNEYAVRADWCVKSYEEANHPPVVNLTVDQDITAKPGEVIELSCTAYDPDNDNLTYSWWQYKEASTSKAVVSINSADRPDASFVCPDDPGKTIHIILEVQD
ncbi:MAG: DUF1593 domain-containing protein, partial [Chlorobi bacterium]|nr:DUF1593 domain-containing protein [Chlorobiota bacterium]